MSATTTNSPQRGALARITARLSPWRMPLGIVVVLLLFAAVEPRVISGANLRNIAVQSSYLAIFSLAQCLVILTRGFDLALGFTVSLASVVSAMVMVTTGEVYLGMAAGFAVGLGVGLCNGLLIGGIGLNPLITTLGVANVVMALASTVSGGFPVAGLPPAFTSVWAQGTFIGLPVQIWITTIVFALVWFMLKGTAFGRSLYIIGANPRAAIASGINSFKCLTLVYVFSAAITTLGALMLTARTGSGEPNLGGNLTLEAIAAAVVGGTRLTGGEGGVGSALLGALFVTVLANGMNLIQLDGYLQQICLGAIIVISLILSRDTARR